jgi:flagellar biogenesis protein FliO
MAYGCFGDGMMSGVYGYGWMLFSWLIGLLITVGLILLIIWIIKKIQNENKHGKSKK